MKTLCVELKNLEPIRVANDDTSQHGQTDTLRYIPGSAVRGLVMHALNQDPEYFEKNKKLLFSDHIQFMNALPTNAGTSMIPSLKGFYEDKTPCGEDGKAIANVLLEDSPEGYKRAGLGQYCYVEQREQEKVIRYTSVELGEDMNINRGRIEKKNVYRSQYIQKGQTFRGYIVFDDAFDDEVGAKLIQDIQNVFSGTVLLGSDRTTGYGTCRCQKSELTDSMPYTEYRNAAESSEFYMVLLSHMTMRDRFGEPTGLDLDILAEKLGVSELKIERCATSIIRVYGYNRTWKGAIPAVTMYEAGSVFRLRTKEGEKVKAESFRKVEAEGLGIRKNEGFGQVAFYDGYAEIGIKQPISAAVVRTEAGVLEGIGERKAKEDLKIAAASLLRSRIEDKMLRYVVNHPLKLNGISNSRLGVIRSMCTELQYAPDRATEDLTYYIGHSRKKDDRKKIHDKKQKGDELYSYIEKILNSELTKLLGLQEPEDKEEYSVLGIPQRELVSEQDMIRYKMKLMIRQIQYGNREVK